MMLVASLVLLAFSVSEAARCYECVHSKVIEGKVLLPSDQSPNQACKTGDPALLEKGVSAGTVAIKDCPHLCGYVEGEFDIGSTSIDRKTYEMTGRGCSDNEEEYVGCDKNKKYMNDLLDILLASNPQAMERDIHESLGCDCDGDLCTSGSAKVGVSVGVILAAIFMKFWLA